jgi:hypothetical protein
VNTRWKKCRNNGTLQVDLRGIEPLSESLSIQASPITVILLAFPLSGAG